MTAAVKKIIRSIDEHPEQWEMSWGDYTLDHTVAGLKIWVCNGFWFYGTYQAHLRDAFGFFDKIRFAFALRRWKAKQPKRVPKPKFTLDDCAALLDQVEAL